MNLDKDLFLKISRSATRGHNYKLYKQHANKLVRINSFSKRIVNDWNGLASKVVNAKTTQEFKNKLDQFWQDKAFMTLFKKMVKCILIRVDIVRQSLFIKPKYIILYIRTIKLFILNSFFC